MPLGLLLFAGAAWPGTTGKVSGRVLDAKKQPLAGVNITIPALHMGAATDQDGRFVILQVPPGSWDLKASLLGYQVVTVQGVRVSADNTATAEVELAEAPIAMKELVISARRPVVDLKLTSSLASIHADQIARLPVQDLQEIVNLQAGVVDGHFLGGRLGEVQYQVDGVSVNNPYNNSNSLQIDRSLIEEVQVVSGTFDAEYGQAMSGVVNTILKRGTEKFAWNAEVYDGAYLFAGPPREMDFKLRPADLRNFQASATGPFGLAKTTYVISGRHYRSRDAVYGTRLFTPWRRDTLANKVLHPDGDREQVPLGRSNEWSGLAKVTNHAIPNLEIGYQAIANWTDRLNANWLYRLNPDGEAPTHTRSVVHGLDLTRTLSTKAFVSASLRQNYFDYRQMKYDHLFDPRYAVAGPATGDDNYIRGAVLEGVDFNRFEQNTNGAIFKSTFTSQIRRDQQIKGGIEYQWPHVRFGNPGTLKFAQSKTGDSLFRHVDEPPDFPGPREYRPFITNAYAQDELEWNDLHLRAGVRMEYFNPRATLPSDLANPANAIAGQPLSHPRAASRKITVAPRIGVSYPVTRKSAVYFAYGHFYQMPELGQIYGNSDYQVLSKLASSSISYGVLGNPDIKPERTVQYQFGFKQSITDDFGIDANMFYKDIRDLLGIEFIDTYNDATYTRLTNVDFGNVIGVTLSVSRRDRWLTTNLDYTWQVAQGNSSDPTETATRASAGEDPRPRTVPFNWDQRHTLNLTATLSEPNAYSLSGIVRIGSGEPYTPATTTNFGYGLEANSGRKPGTVIVDVRGERDVTFRGLPLTVFTRVFNLFDQRFNNGLVFNTSGSPYYSRFPAKDLVTLQDATRFYAPRRVEIGFSMHTPGSE